MLLIHLLALGAFVKVQCEESWTPKQPSIFADNGLAKVNFFSRKEWSYVGCMKFCEKLGGRSPPVRSLQELDEMKGVLNDLTAVSPSPQKLFLAVTRGQVNNSIETLTLEHWPNNIIKTEEELWRDYYTGDQLENYNETWATSKGRLHCAGVQPFESTQNLRWSNLPCSRPLDGRTTVCSCKQDKPLLLRGLCSSSKLKAIGKGQFYHPQHLQDSFDNVFFVLRHNVSKPETEFSKIEFNISSKQWVLSSKDSETRALSSASRESFLVGKHNWTVSKDNQECYLEMGKDQRANYSIELKLSSCQHGFKDDSRGGLSDEVEDYGEFTCNNGECVSMENRCGQ